jgi:hypothetical protein
MNKIFSLSTFGNDPRYVQGAIRQYQLAREMMPEWEFRLYTDNPTAYTDIERGANIIPMSSGYGVFWRFLPLFESPDNVTVVRDSDSRITHREVRAVEEWLASDKTFHVIKDHWAHHQFPVMAGLFGVKGALSDDLRDIMNIFLNGQPYYLSDQNFLRDHVWRDYEHNTFTHSLTDSGWFSESRVRLLNPTSFCGNGYDENDVPLYADPFVDITPDHNFDKGVWTL